MSQRNLVEAAARLRNQHEPHLVATVVRIHGAADRRPGARMLLTQFRWITGSATGGCLEGDLASEGWSRTRDGQPVVVSYDPRVPDGADDDLRSAFGLACDGIVEIMLERAGAPGRVDPLELAARCYKRQQRAAVVTVYRSERPELPVGARLAIVDGESPVGDSRDDAMVADARHALETGESCSRSHDGYDVFVEAIVPPPRLFVFGTGHDALPVVELARATGWEVVVCSAQQRVSNRQRFLAADEICVGTPAELAARVDACARALVVVMGHDYERDRDHLAALVGTRARYIGVLGSRARTVRMLGELGILDEPRIHAPIGLELGAETPQELALAIVAEIQSVLHRAPPSRLEDRADPRPPRARRMTRSNC